MITRSNLGFLSCTIDDKIKVAMGAADDGEKGKAEDCVLEAFDTLLLFLSSHIGKDEIESRVSELLEN